MDESGTPDIPGNTSHFVLVGLSIPVDRWRDCDEEIEKIKKNYGLHGSEIHTGWLLRPYNEQLKISDFESLDWVRRRFEIERFRRSELLRLQKSKNIKHYKQTRKNFQKTEPYVHLTLKERMNLIEEVAKCISNWSFARLFAECIDKVFFDPSKAGQSVEEQAFEQVVSRFEQYLQIITRSNAERTCYGLLIHDNNETVAKKYTGLMKNFHKKGTLWTQVKNIIETPLFVDSHLTSMVQMADICAYALRRYCENKEETLFNLIFKRADRKEGVVVGVRHFTQPKCTCKICSEHRKSVPSLFQI